MREGIQICQSISPGEPHWMIAEAQTILAQILAARGQYEEAETLLLDGYPVTCTTFSEADPSNQSIVRSIIDLYEGWERHEKAGEWRARLSSTKTADPGDD